MVDHYGNLLTGNRTDKDGTPANNARFEAEREAELAERIRELLIPALGGGNVRTVVNWSGLWRRDDCRQSLILSPSGPRCDPK